MAPKIKFKKGKNYLILVGNDEIKVKCDGKVIGSLVTFTDKDGTVYYSNDVMVIKEIY